METVEYSLGCTIDREMRRGIGHRKGNRVGARNTRNVLSPAHIPESQATQAGAGQELVQLLSRKSLAPNIAKVHCVGDGRKNRKIRDGVVVMVTGRPGDTVQLQGLQLRKTHDNPLHSASIQLRIQLYNRLLHRSADSAELEVLNDGKEVVVGGIKKILQTMGKWL